MAYWHLPRPRGAMCCDERELGLEQRAVSPRSLLCRDRGRRGRRHNRVGAISIVARVALGRMGDGGRTQGEATMTICIEGLALENEAIGPNGRPTIGGALDVFRTQWDAGERDRELALHLMFLAWYLSVEPPHLTGLDEVRTPVSSLASVFNAAHDRLLPTGTDTDDVEALYVAGLAAPLCPWVLGETSLWIARSEAYRVRYRQLMPGGISPADHIRAGLDVTATCRLDYGSRRRSGWRSSW